MAASCSFLKAGDARNLARDNVLIWKEICGIQEAILEAIEDHEYDVIVDGGTPMTSTQSILSVTVTGAGVGYDPVVATATIDDNGTGGTLATVTPIVTGTTITGFTVDTAGSGYVPVPATASAATAGTAAVLTPIVTNGVISSVVINSAGTGYAEDDPIIFAHPAGVGAAAHVSSVSLTGQIAEITMTAFGSGYETAVALVTVDHPTGFGFEGTVQVVAGAVVGVSIQDGGALYGDLGPTATITDPTGSGAVLLVNLTEPADGTIDTIEVVSGGFGYTDPVVVIEPAETDTVVTPATATADADENTYGTTPSEFYYEVVGQTDDRVIEDQIQYILDYFTALGYNIRVQVNPATNNTIQWQIIW